MKTLLKITLIILVIMVVIVSCTLYSDTKIETISPPKIRDSIITDPGWNDNTKPPNIEVGH